METTEESQSSTDAESAPLVTGLKGGGYHIGMVCIKCVPMKISDIKNGKIKKNERKSTEFPHGLENLERRLHFSVW